MTKFYPKFYTAVGIYDETTVYIKDSTGTWNEFTSYDYFKVMKKQNQVSEFEINIWDIQTAEKVYVKEFAEIMFLSGKNLILKGRIQKITYSTAYECKATGYGMEAQLLEKELIKSGDKRVQYTNESAQTVANELLSSNTDGVTPWIITPATDGIFSLDYGSVSIRYEYANRLKAIAKLAEIMEYEWRVTQDSEYVDSFELAPLLPTSTRATISQETFAITGASANCYQTSYEKDITNLANKIDGLGYGDGINQLHTSTYNASETFTTLNEDLTATDTTITLTDATDFDSSGEIRIMEERITYTGKTGNNLTGCTRGANSTTARAHRLGCYVEKYVAIASAESGSSIGTNGLSDTTIIDRDIIDLETLELMVSRKLFEKMDPIERILVLPNEPFDTAGSREIGDLITINDAESAISTDYRIVGMTYESNYGDLSLELEASNRTLTFIEQMQKQREETESMSKYMQGSTNVYSLYHAENCTIGQKMPIRFYVPDEAIAINKVLINYKTKPARNPSSIKDNVTETFNYSNLPATLTALGTGLSVTVGTGQKVLVIWSANVDMDASNDDIEMRLYRNGSYITDNRASFYINGADGTACSSRQLLEAPGSGTFTYRLYGSSSATTGDILNANLTIIVFSDSIWTESSISTDTLSIDVFNDSTTVSDTYGPYAGSQTGIDITDTVKAIGAGNWCNIEFDPDSLMRVESSVYIQIFINST